MAWGLNDDIKYYEEKMDELISIERTLQGGIRYIDGDNSHDGNKFPYIERIELKNAFWGQSVSEDIKILNMIDMHIKIPRLIAEEILVSVKEKMQEYKDKLRDLKLRKIEELKSEI